MNAKVVRPRRSVMSTLPVALVPVNPPLACLAATIPSLLAAALDAPLAYGFSMVLASGVLAWSASG